MMKRTVKTFTMTAFLCRPTWWNAAVSPFPLVLISFGGTFAFALDYTTENRRLRHTSCGLVMQLINIFLSCS